jgi:hypothetical protein
MTDAVQDAVTIDDLIKWVELRDPAQQAREAPDQYLLECQRGDRWFDLYEYWDKQACANFCRGGFSGKRDLMSAPLDGLRDSKSPIPPEWSHHRANPFRETLCRQERLGSGWWLATRVFPSPC